jgi:hypothetical protein
MGSPWARLTWLCAFWVPAETRRVVPDWRQVPGRLHDFENDESDENAENRRNM